jgi:hypothetical protein
VHFLIALTQEDERGYPVGFYMWFLHSILVTKGPQGHLNNNGPTYSLCDCGRIYFENRNRWA